MKVNLNEFRFAVALAYAASQRAPVSASRTIRMAVVDGRLELSAGGGGTYLKQTLEPEASSLLAPPPLVLPASVLHAAATSLKGDRVTLNLDEVLHLEVDGYKVAVTPLEDSEPPPQPIEVNPAVRLRFPARAFHESLRYVAQALPKGDEAPRFTKVLLEPKPNGSLRLFATDGYWLTSAEVVGAMEASLETLPKLALHRNLLALLQFLGRAGLEDHATLSFDAEGQRLLLEDFVGRELVLPSSEADFPDFDRFFVDGQPTHLVVEAEELADAVHRMRALLKKEEPVHLYFVPEAQRLLVRARGEYGAAEANLEVRGSGPSFRLAFSPAYLLGALRGLGQAALRFGGQRDPLVVEGASAQAVVMPLVLPDDGVWADYDVADKKEVA